MKAILGTGQLGLAIMETLLKDKPNEKIVLVNRKGTLDKIVPDNVKIIAADVTNKHDMEELARKSEVILVALMFPISYGIIFIRQLLLLWLMP